jgi:hypothetical protein
MNDQAIEQEIQAKGKTAPRITPADIEANIKSEHFFTAADGVGGAALNNATVDVVDGKLVVTMPAEMKLLTFCVLVLKNGFTVTGESACASPENFDAEIGRNIARQNAVQKIWPLMGYQLRDQIHAEAEKARKEEEAQANRPNQNCVFRYCPDEAICRAHGCQMVAPA